MFSDFKPDVVIHAAALGNVDFCEKVPYAAEQVNVTGTQNIVNILNELKYKTKVVYISTNAVYNGENPPYTEESEQHPVNKYGYTKFASEKYIKRNCDKWLIFRPILMYGLPYLTGRDNWLTILMDKFENDEEISLVTDIMWQPTSANFCAKTIWALIDKENESFNVSQDHTMTMYDFGRLVQSIFAPDKDLINPTESNKLPSLTKRPKDTSYDVTKIKQYVEIPTVESELSGYKDELQLLYKTATPRIY